jgi:hypothetical protein
VAFPFHASVGLAPFLSQLAERMTYYSRSSLFLIDDLRFLIRAGAIINRKSEILNSFGGADGIRTHCLFNAIEALSQLSYGPKLILDL